MFTNMQSFWNPEEMTKAFQQSLDLATAVQASQKNVETFQQASTVMAKTLNSCFEYQAKVFQEAVQDSSDAMRQLASAQGIEELMNTQGTLTKKVTEKTQQTSQELAKMIQDGQTKAIDIVTKQMMQNIQATASASKAAAK